MEYDMVFEGGGAKGMVFVGAMQELERRGCVPARLMGASAGAIMATFLAAGYSASEMAAALSETIENKPVFTRFLEVPPMPTEDEVRHSAIRQLLADIDFKAVPNFVEKYLDDALAEILTTSSDVTNQAFSFIEKGGLYSGNFFLNWLHNKLNEGVYTLARGEFGQGQRRAFGAMNLAEFRAATGVDLSLIASDTTDGRILILNHRTAPQCPVIWAVRMSMSFPLLWQEVIWQPEWGPYRGKKINGHSVVDGGMLSNFPIELFLSDEPYVTDVMGDKQGADFSVIGFLIDEAIEVPGAPPATSSSLPSGFSQFRTVQRINRLINTMTQAHDKAVIDAYEDYVVRLPAKGYGTTEFGMSQARRQALVEAGRAYTEAYFNRQQSLSKGLPTEGAPIAAPPVGTTTVTNSANRTAVRILQR